MISFGSLKEAHNNLCAEKKDYKSKWLGDPYIDDGDISVSAYKCCKCGIEGNFGIVKIENVIGKFQVNLSILMESNKLFKQILSRFLPTRLC